MVQLLDDGKSCIIEGDSKMTMLDQFNPPRDKLRESDRARRVPITGNEIMVKISDGEFKDRWLVIGENAVGFLGDCNEPFTPLYSYLVLDEISREYYYLLRAACDHLKNTNAYYGRLDKLIQGSNPPSEKSPFYKLFEKKWFNFFLGVCFTIVAINIASHINDVYHILTR